MADWKVELRRAVNEVLLKGGEIRVNISKRGQQRIIIVQKFPENYIRCDEETVITDD